MFIYSRMNKQNVVFSCNGIRLSIKQSEQTFISNISLSKRRKENTREQILMTLTTMVKLFYINKIPKWLLL